MKWLSYYCLSEDLLYLGALTHMQSILTSRHRQHQHQHCEHEHEHQRHCLKSF